MIGVGAEMRSRVMLAGAAVGFVVRIAGLASCIVRGSIGASAPLLSR